MARTKTGTQQIRKLQKTGSEQGSYMLTLPKEFVRELGWREKQKVVVERKGKTLIIRDWQE